MFWTDNKLFNTNEEKIKCPDEVEMITGISLFSVTKREMVKRADFEDGETIYVFSVMYPDRYYYNGYFVKVDTKEVADEMEALGNLAQQAYNYADTRERIELNKKRHKIIKEALQQLETYRKIERHIGVNLAVLYNGLTNGIYVIGDDNSIDFVAEPEWRPQYSILDWTRWQCPCFIKGGCKVYNYGKKMAGGWALTREELEK